MTLAAVVGIWIVAGLAFYALRRRAGRRSLSISLQDGLQERI